MDSTLMMSYGIRYVIALIDETRIETKYKIELKLRDPEVLK